MNATQAYLAALHPGMDIIAGVADLPEATGPVCRELLELHATYFGETTFTRKQRAAREAASEISLTALRIIEKRIRPVKPEHRRWDLRIELCALRLDDDALDRHARARARQLTAPSDPEPGVRVRRRKGKNWSLIFTGNSADIADMSAAVGSTWESAVKFFFSGKAANRSQRVTNVVISLEQLAEVVSSGGTEVDLQLSNGAQITGAQLVQGLLAETGLATLVDPVEGPVNLYRLSRFASDKQRAMALAENPVCAWPGCNTPGEKCQVHHLDAWSRGGNTNMSNLCMLCAYHNGINEDNPNAPPRRGRMKRVNGRVSWQPPWASSPD